MIATIRPFGAISESEIILIVEKKNDFFLIDNYGNKWKIHKDEFIHLENKGYKIKEE